MRLLLNSLLLLLAGLATAQSGKARVLLAPVDVLDGKILPEMVKKETAEAIGQAVELYIAQQLHKEGSEMVKAVQADKQLTALKEGLASRNVRDVMDTLEAAANDANVDYVIFVQISRWSQRDKSPREILNSPTGPGSETKVELRLWLFGKRDRVLFSEGAKTLESTMQGAIIGTQKRNELMGTPADEMAIINNINRRRMLYIAKASWDAVKPFAVRAGLAK